MIYKQKWIGRIHDKDVENRWFEAKVPGNIQYDYGVANDFGDPNDMDNHLKYRTLEDYTWEYKTQLSYQKNDDETVWFVSLGIDYCYDILLNGNIIYSHEGMYKKIQLDITDKLIGNDELSVVIYPHPKRPGSVVGTKQEASACFKPPVCYGWDWQPRLLISGMWQDAYIETRKADYIYYCEPFAKLNEDMTMGTIDFAIECNGEYEITISDAKGNVIYKDSKTHIVIYNPELWWCNGQGEPVLYTWKVRSASDEKSGTLAFKKLRLVRNAGDTNPDGFPKSRYNAPITVELNGRRILIKGSNWVNPELFFGNIDDACYEPLLLAARDANMNMLRIWGGSGINKESFYDICDRLGILVWQEFPLSCNEYPDSEDYLKVLESEAIAIVELLRHHACLAFWCGGNELFNSWSGMDDQSLPLRRLDAICYQYDYGRPFLKTSPLSGMAHGGYTFTHPQIDVDMVHEFRKSNFTAYTEFGVPSITDMETLKRIIPESELFPITATQAWIERHGIKAWGYDAWVCQPILETYFGKAESLEQLIEWSETLQCIGYQSAFETMRQQWPHCSMMLNWCFNEPWSNAANNCIISYPARTRKAYYSVKSALRPTIFSAGFDRYDWREGEQFSADIWLLNDKPEKTSGCVRVELVIGEQINKLIEWTAEAGPNSNTQGPTVHAVIPTSEEDFFVLRLVSDNGMENEYKLLLRHLPRKGNVVKRLNE